MCKPNKNFKPVYIQPDTSKNVSLHEDVFKQGVVPMGVFCPSPPPPPECFRTVRVGLDHNASFDSDVRK